MTGVTGFTHIRPGPEANLLNHENRIRLLENSDMSGDWVYVDDGSGNPLIIPSISPPFLNSWTNIGAPYHPVSFKRFANWIHLRGAFEGGAANTVIFNLPAGWRPGATEVIVLALSDGTGTATVSVAASGDVTYLSQGAF